MKEKIIYQFKNLIRGNYEIEIGNGTSIMYRSENGEWNDQSTIPFIDDVQKDFEKSYQRYKREEKLKRILNDNR